MAKPYSTKETLTQKYSSKIKELIYKWLTKDALPLFLRGQDNITFSPLVLGYHEIRIKQLIEHCAKNGYQDFLLDIGANIGLSSCQSGNLDRKSVV